MPQVDSIEIADRDECSLCRGFEVFKTNNGLLRHAIRIYYVRIVLPRSGSVLTPDASQESMDKQVLATRPRECGGATLEHG